MENKEIMKRLEKEMDLAMEIALENRERGMKDNDETWLRQARESMNDAIQTAYIMFKLDLISLGDFRDKRKLLVDRFYGVDGAYYG